MDSLIVKNFGPIKEADVQFGDLTILVGPQASGKSIFLQLLKLVEDKELIIDLLKKNAYVWENTTQLLELYFGEGMKNIWTSSSSVTYNNHQLSNNGLLNDVIDNRMANTILYIPAQRVLTLQNGWPKPFGEYSLDHPFVLRSFSEIIRLYLEGKTTATFLTQLEQRVQHSLFSSIYYSGRLELDTSTLRKRFILNVEDNNLPYMVWSTGQKEILPFFLSVNMLLNPNIIGEANGRSVIIEEPEMGLHPKAINALILELIELISAGYKVVISTHSSVFLEFAWAFQLLKQSNVNESAFLELFELEKTPANSKLFSKILTKTINTYFFNRKEKGVIVENISSLDAGSENPDIAEWGGLTSFATRATDIVSKYVVNEE